MDWFAICSNYYDKGYYTNETLKVFVVKNKITVAQYLAITGGIYIV